MSAPAPIEVAALILAGGRGQRMGGCLKPLLTVAGRTVLERQLEVLRPLFPWIAISAGEAAPFAATGLPVLLDEVAGQGPLGGIAAGLARSPARWLFVVAGDMPALDPRMIDRLLAEITRETAGPGGSPTGDRPRLILPRLAGRLQPLHALYRRDCREVVASRLRAGLRRAVALADDERLRVTVLEEEVWRAIDPGLHGFAGINTPEQLAALEGTAGPTGGTSSS